MILSHWLDEIATQAELLEILRQCKNPITDTFAALLGAEGKDGWKLTLTKSGRGPLTGRRGGEAHYVMSCYDEALEKYSGHRKRVQLAELEIADQFNMTQDAARSFVRRVKGTHSKPRKRKGRK